MNYNKSTTRWRFLSLLTLWCLFGPGSAANSMAENYNQWLSAAQDKSGSLLIISPLPAAEPPETFAAVSNYYGRYSAPSGASIKVPSRPAGGAIGLLSLANLSPNYFPVHLVIRGSEVEASDLAPVTGRAPFNVWSADSEALNRNAPIRRTLFEEESVFDSAPPDQMVLRLPASSQGQYSAPLLMSLRIELRDARGNAIARALPVPVYRPRPESAGQALVAADGNLERYFRDTLNLKSFRTLRIMPSDVWALAETPVLGLNEAVIASSKLTTTMAREALLAGSQIFGSGSAVAQFAAIAGAPPNAGILLGKLSAVSDEVLAASTNGGTNDYYTPISLSEPRGPWQQLGSAAPVEGIFSPYRRAYTRWSVLLLTAFSIVLIAGIPFGFFVLPAAYRLHIWWGVPGLALAVSVISYGLGNVILPRAPLVQISEYRFGYQGWPEVYHRTALRLLNFRDEELTFTGNSKLTVSWPTTPSYEHSEPLMLKVKRDSQNTTLSLRSLGRGNPQVVETRFFDTAPLPLEARTLSNDLSIHANRDIKRGYLLDASKVYAFGPLARGMEISRQQLVAGTKVNGLIPSISSYLEIPAFYTQSLGQNKNFTFGREKLGDSGLVVIASTSETPSLLAPETASTTFSEVTWLIQSGPVGATAPTAQEDL